MRPQPFRRSTTDRRVAGICGALAQRLGLNADLVRLGVLFLILVTRGGALLAYVLAWLFIPDAPDGWGLQQRRATRSARSARSRGGIGRTVLLVVLALVVLRAASPAVWLLLLVALVVWLVVRTRQRPNRRPAGQSGELARAMAAWQDRLAKLRATTDQPSAAPALPSSLAEALALDPDAAGFIPGDRVEPAPGWAPAAGPVAPPSPQPGRLAMTEATGRADPSRLSADALAHLPDAARGPGSDRLAPQGAAAGPAATCRQGPGPLTVEAFLPAESATEPLAGAATTVAVRRPGAALMGWLVIILSAGSVLGLAGILGDRYWTDPLQVAGTISAVLGAGLVASPWAGRPRWLAPAAGVLLAGGAGALLLLSVFHYL